MKKAWFRRAVNRLLALGARNLPGATTVRPWLHRLRGVKIRGKVFIGDDVYLENEYPEAVELEEGVQLCVRTIVLAHNRGAGRIVMGKNAFVGANCVITASAGRTLRIGEGAVVTAASVVSCDVPDFTLVGNPKAVPLARVTTPLTLHTSYDEFVHGLRPLPTTFVVDKTKPS
jgi:acetyltransferase-like isoleucine patch superfamily enzyme